MNIDKKPCFLHVYVNGFKVFLQEKPPGGTHKEGFHLVQNLRS